MKNRKNSRILFFCAFLCLSVTVFADTKSNLKTGFYKSGFEIVLFTSAVLLILSDFKLLIASSSNKLIEGNEQNFSEENLSLINALLLDEKPFHFMEMDILPFSSFDILVEQADKYRTASYTIPYLYMVEERILQIQIRNFCFSKFNFIHKQ